MLEWPAATGNGAPRAKRAIALFALLVATAACGRIGYDPIGGTRDAGDAGDAGDASAFDGDVGPTDGGVPDAFLGSALLAELTVSAGGPVALSPTFSPVVMTYVSEVSLLVDPVTVRARAMDPNAQIDIAGVVMGTGTASAVMPLTLGLNEVPITVTSPSGAAESYTVSISRLGDVTQRVYLKASNSDSEDWFGNDRSIALSGDTLVVGAYGESSSATGVDGDQSNNDSFRSGGVYVFTRTAGIWSQQAYLKASNGDADDHFGRVLALSGDTLAVSAPLEDSSARGVDGDQRDNTALNAGAVYIFTRIGRVWSQQAYLKASNAEAGDQFGLRVALEGDTLAVTSSVEGSAARGIDGDQGDNTAADAGAAYVFTRTSGVWSQQAYLKASNTEANDQFGVSVALRNDTLAVAAYFEGSGARGVDGNQSSNTAPRAGAVYVFTRSAGVWSQEAYLKASNTDADDRFGSSLGLSGQALAIGAQGEASRARGIDGDQSDNSAPIAGAVYVFTRTGTRWSQQAYLKASNAEADDWFGNAIALFGSTLAVSAFGEASNATGVNGDQSNNSATRAGAVYVFSRSRGIWSQHAYVKASNTEAQDWFGNGVALVGETLAIGARFEDSGARGTGGDQSDNSADGAGAVYLFE